MFTEHVIVAIIVFMGGIVTTVLGWYASRTFGIGPQQTILVKTLQDVINAQEDKIAQLEGLVKDQDATIKNHENRMKSLESVIIDQQRKLDDLRK